MQPPAPSLLDGTTYRFVRVRGRGGMALVVDAEHDEHGAVVVKLLAHDDASAAERFRAEGAALARLRHPNLVRVVDTGVTASGARYLALERVEGRSLADEIALRGPLPLERALAIARQALAGLEEAHRHGVVHRDVKPANVLVAGPDDHPLVKVIDFGIAKFAPHGALASLAPAATAPGELLGTPSAMAPEQLQGRAVTPATDVFAMGLVLYELLTGRHPFAEHRTERALVGALLLAMPPPPSTIAPVPPLTLINPSSSRIMSFGAVHPDSLPVR